MSTNAPDHGNASDTHDAHTVYETRSMIELDYFLHAVSRPLVGMMNIIMTNHIRYASSPNGIPHEQFAAKRCAISLFSSLKHALDGDWNRLQSLVRLEVFIRCSGDFQQHARVANGASVWIHSILQEKSMHSRFAMGAPSLPLGCVVEIALIAQLTP